MSRPIILLLTAALVGGCTSMRLTQADEAYERMAYTKAAEHYERALAGINDPKKAALQRPAMLRAADAYRRNHDMPHASAWYERAAALGELNMEQAFQYGLVLMTLNDRASAAEQFLTVLATNPEHRSAQDLLLSCESYPEFFEDTLQYVVSEVPMSTGINAFSAIPYADGIVVAGERPAGLDRTDPWTGQAFLDLYFVKKRTAATWDEPQPLKGEVNGSYHEGPAVFSADGRTMYFTRSNYYKFKLMKDGSGLSHLKLFRATLGADGAWGDIHAFTYNGEDFSTGHAALSTDGNILYFASDRPGSVGGSDLWRCVNNGTGWGPPENLGPTINTAGDELFPTVVGDALYFSSTAHQNMGGLDIFVTNPEGGAWAEPKNVGHPINGRFDDFAFTLNADAKSGYISSDRTGVDRIHQFFVQEPIFFLDGIVLNGRDGVFLTLAEVRLTNLLTNEDSTMTTSADGRFHFRMQPNSTYLLQVMHDGMLTETRDISTQGLAVAKTVHEDLRMRPVELNKSFVVNNIYFDYDLWDIRPDAAAELNKLARVFNDNPQLSFELSAHTDCRGGDLYNLVLSDARANSTVDYLIRAGVDSSRLVARGYGENMLTNRCADGVPCTEEEHQANRRTEFKVIKVKELASTRP